METVNTKYINIDIEGNTLRFIISNARLSNKVNNILKHYEYTFSSKIYEEALFCIRKDEFIRISAVLPRALVSILKQKIS